MFNENNEARFDPIFEKYGYVTPTKIRAGHLTLKQFDEFINEHKKTKSLDFINQFAETSKLNVTDLHILVEYYKPFLKIDKTSSSNNKTESTKQLNAESDVNNVFPNIR